MGSSNNLYIQSERRYIMEVIKQKELWKEQLQNCLSKLDVEYSYQLAKRMEQEKTNPVLGYRTAGSKAEIATGNMLYEEMKRIGLSDVTKDEFRLDSWEFEKAVLKFKDKEGREYCCQLGAYQTNFVTDGFQEYEIVYVNKGTAADYEGIDVEGKLVLAEINQRDEWWINYPAYQAYLKGAVGLIAVQEHGYGEKYDTSLNAQDIAGPEYAAAFSMSQADAKKLKECMGISVESNIDSECAAKRPTSAKVWLDAKSTVQRNVPAYNIVGKIPGEETEQMILLTAHYDSYFDGFQDDNAAVAMIIGMAKTMLDGGYRPAHTIVVCAVAAEEWGVSDSKFDWSTGAYNQVFRVHPEWRGHVLADLNFELPAHAHHSRDAIRGTYEYADFFEQFVRKIDVPKEAYPDGMTVLYPIETWSDDFSISIAGIPSMVNDFSDGPFMENYYHSQYDNEELYEEPVYRFHHELYLRLILEMDKLVLPPLDFGRMFRAMKGSLDERKIVQGTERALSWEKEKEQSDWMKDSSIQELERLVDSAIIQADTLYEQIQTVNREYQNLASIEERKAYRKQYLKKGEALLRIYQKTQDYFTRLDWEDEVKFPHEAVKRNIRELQCALKSLKQRKIRDTLESIYKVDNNCFAFLFDDEVYYHFTEYILHQPKERLMWGAGRIWHHENLYGIVQRLRRKMQEENPKLNEEIRRLEAAIYRQKNCYEDDIRYMIRSLEKIRKMMGEL